MADPVFVDDATPLNAVNMNKLQTRDEKAAANGYASLDGTGKVPTAQLPPASGAIPPTIVDAKGDLIVASAADVVDRLPRGTDGYVLTVDAAQPLGLKYAAPATGGGTQAVPITIGNPAASAAFGPGNSFFTVAAMTAWDAGHWEFVRDVDGYIMGSALIPAGVTAANIRLALAASVAGGVSRMFIATAAAGDGESLNPASLTASTPQDVTMPGTAWLRKDVLFALTGLTPGKLLIISIGHNGAHANDTLAANTNLFGAWLEPA